MITILLCIVLFVALLLVAAVRPIRGTLSAYELERRIKAGDAHAKETQHREALLDDVESLKKVAEALLLVVFVLSSVAAFGWLFGVVVSVIVALEYAAIARMPVVLQWAQKLYERYEERILAVIDRFGGVMKFLRTVQKEHEAPHVSSREELEYLVGTSSQLLSVDEKKRIVSTLAFDARIVKDVMTPRGVIDSVGKDEVLGPLVLDGLHKTGHSRFPVIDGDIDHVIGMLYAHDLLNLSSRQSKTAMEAMDSKVFYVKEDQDLGHALAAFLKTKHHLFVVVNEFRETVGLLSLEDVLEALLGYEIVDEFDLHDDLRVVAARNPRANNRPKSGKDV